MNANEPQDLYGARGVSAQKGAVRRAVARLDAGLYPNAFAKLLPDVLADDPAFAFALHTDTAGTKPVVAYLLWRETGDLAVWRGLVQDAIVMNLDDLACVGPQRCVVFSANLARNARNVPDEVVETLIAAGQDYLDSLQELGVEAILAGGETADVGDVVRTADVGFTAAARFRRDEILENNFRPGHVIVGLASDGQTSYETSPNSGIGCNGLTSARHDLLSADYARDYPESFEPSLPENVRYIGRYRLLDAPEGLGMTVGQALLSPTRTYTPVLNEVFMRLRPALSGVVHCTGGGQTKCLRFARNVDIVKDALPEPPPVFRLIQAAAPTPWRQMYRAFNMGVRMEIMLDPAAADELIALAAEFGLRAWVTGRVEPQTGPRPALRILAQGETFLYED